MVSVVGCLQKSVVGKVPPCVLEEGERESEHSLCGSEGGGRHHLIVDRSPLPVRGRARPSAVLVLEEHSSESVASEVASRPRFHVGRGEDAGLGPEGVDEGRVELLNSVGILVPSRGVEVLTVERRVEAQNVSHFVDGRCGNRLKEQIRERGDSVDQVVSVEDHAAHSRPPNLKSVIRITPRHIIARLTCSSIAKCCTSISNISCKNQKLCISYNTSSTCRGEINTIGWNSNRG